MVGIICAMDVEAEYLLGHLKNKKEEQISGIKFISGDVCDQNTVVAVCGVSKVFAAMCTQTMILRYQPEIIINCGVGGSLSDRLHIGNVAVATSVVQYDIDITALGELPGMIPGINIINLPCDKKAVDIFVQYSIDDGVRKPRAVIASGDTFIADKHKKESLFDWYGASVCDMESAAIAQVCFVNNTPLAAIRSISDEANGTSCDDYEKFKISSAEKAGAMILKYLKERSC